MAAEHWQSFAQQNYFDKNGIFVSVVFSAPLLCAAMCSSPAGSRAGSLATAHLHNVELPSALMLCRFMLLNALRAASKMLIQVKTYELKAARRKKKPKES